MSSAPDLTHSVDFLATLGVMTEEEANNVEHCVDDAVDALSAITDVIRENPQIQDLIKEAVAKEKQT